MVSALWSCHPKQHVQLDPLYVSKPTASQEAGYVGGYTHTQQWSWHAQRRAQETSQHETEYSKCLAGQLRAFVCGDTLNVYAN